MGKLMEPLMTAGGAAAGSAAGPAGTAAGAEVGSQLGSMFGGGSTPSGSAPAPAGSGQAGPTFPAQPAPTAITAASPTSAAFGNGQTPSLINPNDAPAAIQQGGSQALNAGVRQATMPNLQDLIQYLSTLGQKRSV